MKIKVSFSYLNRFNQVQLRIYTPTGKYLKPITNWYKIGTEWGLKIKKGQYAMKRTNALIDSFNKKLDELDARKIPYSLYFFDATRYFDVITNINFDEKRGYDYKKTTSRHLETELD